MRKAIVLAVLILATIGVSAQWPVILPFDQIGAIDSDPTSGGVFIHQHPNRLIAVDGDPLGDTTSVVVGNHAGDIVYCPSNGLIYCANTGTWPDQWDSTISVVDAATMTVVDTIVVGLAPSSLCLAEDARRLYCTQAPLSQGTRVYSIDIDSNRVVAAIDVGATSGPMQYVPGHRKLYVADHYGYYIRVIAGDSLVASIPVRGSLRKSMTYNPNFGKLYCYMYSYISVIDVTLDLEVAQISGPWMGSVLGYSTAGDRLYIICDMNCTVADGASDTIITHFVLEHCQYAGEIAYSPRSERIYISYWGSGDVSVLDGRTSTVLNRVNTLNHSPGKIVVNERSRLVFAHALNALVVFPDTGHFVALEENKAEGGGRRLEPLRPTILRAPELARMDCRVHDITGRDVTERRAVLSPGVYFLRSADGGPRTAVRKVILQ